MHYSYALSSGEVGPEAPRGTQEGWSSAHDVLLLLGIPQALGAMRRKVYVLPRCALPIRIAGDAVLFNSGWKLLAVRNP